VQKDFLQIQQSYFFLISKMLQQLAKNYSVSVIPAGIYARLSCLDALRVNANLFQTDLCRNPDYKDVLNLPSMALDTRFPASMTDFIVSAESSY
jgi:hypothetical protein